MNKLLAFSLVVVITFSTLVGCSGRRTIPRRDAHEQPEVAQKPVVDEQQEPAAEAPADLAPPNPADVAEPQSSGPRATASDESAEQTSDAAESLSLSPPANQADAAPLLEPSAIDDAPSPPSPTTNELKKPVTESDIGTWEDLLDDPTDAAQPPAPLASEGDKTATQEKTTADDGLKELFSHDPRSDERNLDVRAADDAEPGDKAAPIHSGDLPEPPPETDGFRVWMDVSGQHTLEARFLEVVGMHVRLARRDGKVFRIELDKLSLADRRLVNQLREPAKKIEL